MKLLIENGFSLYRFAPFRLINGSHKVHTDDAKNAKKCRFQVLLVLCDIP